MNAKVLHSISRSFVVPLLVGLVLASCKSGGGGGESAFSFLEPEVPLQNQDGTIKIESASPVESPVVIVGSASTNFGIVVNSEAGNSVSFKWSLAGTQVASTSVPFYSLQGDLAYPGVQTLSVTATNSVSTATHEFIIRKNSPPRLSFLQPSQSGGSVACGSGSLNMSATGTDADSDSLTFTWKLNGAISPSTLPATTLANSSSATFSPTCALSGSHTISLEVSDGYEATTYSWVVSVADPTVANISSYSPTAATIIIPSTGNQSFSVAATGKAPLSYSWKLNGTSIPSATTSILNLAASSLTNGPHTLVVTVSDSDSSDSHTFSIVKNSPPVISNANPALSTLNTNFQTLKTFRVDVTDANSDALTYTWTLDGINHGSLSASTPAGGAQVIFSPTIGLVGSHTIQLVASDGVETASQTWTVNVNFFSNACNDLAAGQICTLVGKAGLGDGGNPQSSSDRVVFQATQVARDGSTGYFFSDAVNDLIWYYNISGAAVTRLGISIPPAAAKIVVGTGADGAGSDGQTNTNFKIAQPQAIVWDAANSRLFLADYLNNRVVMFDSAGVGRRVFGNGSNGNNQANHTDGAAATTHACYRPTGLALDSVRERLYVACNEHHYIKYVDISAADLEDWTATVLLGRKNGSGTISGGSEDGVIGTSGSAARANRPWDITLDHQGNLYFSEYAGCRVRVINLSGAGKTYFGGDVSVSDGRVGSLFGVYNSCDTTLGARTSLKLNRPRGVALHLDGSTLKGFFVASTDHHRVLYINQSGATAQYGSKQVLDKQGQNIFGNGTADYNGHGLSGSLTYVSSPMGIDYDSAGSRLIVADTGNFRLRGLDISVPNGIVSQIAKGVSKAGFSGDADQAATAVEMSQPSMMSVDRANNLMYFGDAGNGRIKTVDLSTGLVKTALGGGIGNATVENETPLAVLSRAIRGIALVGSDLLYADRNNNNCMVRFWNRSGADKVEFNSLVENNRVRTVLGSYGGCTGWVAGNEGAQANSVTLDDFEGMAVRSGELIAVLSVNHCLVKVAPGGTLSSFVGKCGTAANVDGDISSGLVRLRSPVGLNEDPRIAGNYFIVDASDQGTSYIKYLNLSSSNVTIASSSVPPNQIMTVITTAGYSTGVAAFDNQICYTSGQPGSGANGAHHVICINRDDSLGNTTMRAGPAMGPIRGGNQLSTNHEGISASSALMFAPYGLDFDNSGNLYITEQSNHVIRKVKRWW